MKLEEVLKIIKEFVKEYNDEQDIYEGDSLIHEDDESYINMMNKLHNSTKE